MDAVCEQFDSQSKVPVKTSAHATRDDTTDITKVVKTIQDNDLLNIIQGRSHRTFAKIRLNPLWNWDRIGTLEWIRKKMKDFTKNRGLSVREPEELEDEEDDDEEDERDEY